MLLNLVKCFILIIFISLFERMKGNLFPAFAFEFILLTNLDELSPVKEIATFFSAFLPKWSKQEPKVPPDWIMLDIQALLSFRFVYI